MDLADAAPRSPRHRAQATARPAGLAGADAAMLELVRLVLDDAWSHQPAAERLVQLVDGDAHVLRRVRARVLRAARERETAVTDRALRTLDAALRTSATS